MTSQETSEVDLESELCICPQVSRRHEQKPRRPGAERSEYTQKGPALDRYLVHNLAFHSAPYSLSLMYFNPNFLFRAF